MAMRRRGFALLRRAVVSAARRNPTTAVTNQRARAAAKNFAKVFQGRAAEHT